ncbi:hypothetical protein [Mycoplasma procyoni]|uniref:hypothetical protein n=1 Tax=Mycoplasma procyoni TaxID=568784 RepID=UPI00197B6570|nr:hypothetical protein [Mycoplasma procyoni]MBN3534674.1 hypothetical protein [Mycoplasma procyoni]
MIQKTINFLIPFNTSVLNCKYSSYKDIEKFDFYIIAIFYESEGFLTEPVLKTLKNKLNLKDDFDDFVISKIKRLLETKTLSFKEDEKINIKEAYFGNIKLEPKLRNKIKQGEFKEIDAEIKTKNLYIWKNLYTNKVIIDSNKNKTLKENKSSVNFYFPNTLNIKDVSENELEEKLGKSNFLKDFELNEINQKIKDENILINIDFQTNQIIFEEDKQKINIKTLSLLNIEEKVIKNILDGFFKDLEILKINSIKHDDLKVQNYLEAINLDFSLISKQINESKLFFEFLKETNDSILILENNELFEIKSEHKDFKIFHSEITKPINYRITNNLFKTRFTNKINFKNILYNFEILNKMNENYRKFLINEFLNSSKEIKILNFWNALECLLKNTENEWFNKLLKELDYNNFFILEQVFGKNAQNLLDSKLLEKVVEFDIYFNNKSLLDFFKEKITSREYIAKIIKLYRLEKISVESNPFINSRILKEFERKYKDLEIKIKENFEMEVLQNLRGELEQLKKETKDNQIFIPDYTLNLEKDFEVKWRLSMEDQLKEAESLATKFRNLVEEEGKTKTKDFFKQKYILNDEELKRIIKINELSNTFAHRSGGEEVKMKRIVEYTLKQFIDDINWVKALKPRKKKEGKDVSTN